MTKDTEIVRTSLRIPKALYEQLEKSAGERGLTMHADILSRLEASFLWSETDREFRSALHGDDAPPPRRGGLFGLLPIREEADLLPEEDRKAARMLAQAVLDYMEKKPKD